MRWPQISLQAVVLVPVLALMIIAATVLYFFVVRTVGSFADENFRANLDSLARTAFAIADSEVDRQNREGRAGDDSATPLYQLNARIRFEDFTREHEIGLVIEADEETDFVAGVPGIDDEAIRRNAPNTGIERVRLSDGDAYYVRKIRFAPWDWNLVLFKGSTAFDELVDEVRLISLGAAAGLLLFAMLLLVWLRVALVRSIYQLADEFSQGRVPRNQRITELQFLSERIGRMMESLKDKTQHLEAILENMTDGIAVFDSEMRLAAWNKNFVDHYRYPTQLVRDGASFGDIMRFNVDRGDYGPGDPNEQLASVIKRARELDPPRFEIDRADGTSTEVRRARMPDGGFVSTYTDTVLSSMDAPWKARVFNLRQCGFAVIYPASRCGVVFSRGP